MTNKIVYNVDSMVKEVAKENDMTQVAVRNTIDAMAKTLKRLLGEATADTEIEVKVLPYLTLTTQYVPSHEARNPSTGETFMAAPKQRVKAKIGKALKDAVNE